MVCSHCTDSAAGGQTAVQNLKVNSAAAQLPTFDSGVEWGVGLQSDAEAQLQSEVGLQRQMQNCSISVSRRIFRAQHRLATSVRVASQVKSFKTV